MSLSHLSMRPLCPLNFIGATWALNWNKQATDLNDSQISIATQCNAKQTQKKKMVTYIYGLMQDCSISITNTLEILQYCIKPSLCICKCNHIEHLEHWNHIHNVLYHSAPAQWIPWIRTPMIRSLRSKITHDMIMTKQSATKTYA